MTHAHITWTPTSLGADFAATYVQRQHTDGWFDIAVSTTEATAEFDDHECLRGVEESYRVVVEDIYGVRSVPPSAATVTLTGTTFLLVSNEDPSINQEFNVEYPFTPSFPERVSVTPTVGRYGQRLHRSTDRQGETYTLSVDLSGATGPALWRTLVEQTREALSYHCVLSPWGDRWFAGLIPQTASMPFFTRAHLQVQMVEVTDTPSVVTF